MKPIHRDAHAGPEAPASPVENPELDRLITEKDWSQTLIGPMSNWSPTLKTTVNFLIANRFPILLWWGPDYVSIYNDAYRSVLATKHPWALGEPFRNVWPEIAHVLLPLIDAPFNGGPASWMDGILLEVKRQGFTEETYFTFAYSPVPDDTAPRGIGGVIATVVEVTDKIIGERRITALRDLGASASEGRTAEEACTFAARALENHDKDVPFALLYLLDAKGETARLAAAAGVAEGGPANVSLVSLDGCEAGPWPLAQALTRRAPVTVENLAQRLSKVPAGPWSDPPHAAVIVPIASSSVNQISGFLVAGVSPRLRFDEQYRSFLELVATQIASAINGARSYEEERKRSEALAAVDRAKTLFFSNVSHEFRTPLSLILGPLSDAVSGGSNLGGAQLDLVHRNSMRLLRLVNSLLDFSRIEAGRAEANYAATDLSALTAELAGNFRSACDRADLELIVNCPTLPSPVHVDREMWEKIVLNLVANAFKFTFAGEIEVAMRPVDGAAELVVRDTGVGIPEAEQPRLFERFHRIEGQKSRTHEGSGIGLALIQELVKLHGGTIEAASAVDRGTTFRVRIPFGTAHLPSDRLEVKSNLSSTSIRADAFVQEAMRWLPDHAAVGPSDQTVDGPMESVGLSGGHRLLIADDNADMRDYLRRLLRSHCEVRTVADGEAALAEVRRQRPDLILADVMMPRLDGFGLVREIRADPALRDIPVILLSARAGEGNRIEGFDAGATDYLVKPFSSRELIACIGANINLARVRSEATAALRASEERYRALVTASCYAVYRMNRDWTEMIQLAGHGFMVDTEDPSRGWLTTYIHPDDQPQVTAEIERAIASKSMFELEHRVLQIDGTLGWTHSRAVPMLDERGEIVEWFGAASDVTDRKRAETALREMNDTLERRVAEETAERMKVEEALRQSQKMEAIGQLTGGLAHDFNNLLAAVGGSLDLIGRRVVDGKPGIDRYVQAGREAVRRAATLTQRLLAFSRRQNLDPKPINANRLIAEMEELIRRTVGPSIHLEVVGAGGLWPTKIDGTQLESALLNLCINARDAMAADGGKLTIETANKWLDERAARERDLPPGQYVSISVTDTGTGMPAEIIAKVFDPFFTTKPIGQGTGLGLSMVYGFVRQSGGQVRVYSEPGRGTTMTLYFPRHLGAEEEGPNINLPSRIQVGGGETILIVDDEPTLRMLISDALEEGGYNVFTAKDGANALRHLQSDLAVDLLITDVGLPGGMNGRQLADEARKHRPDLKVLFITGFAENAAVGHGHLASGMEVMGKPFEIASLVEKVKALIDS
jgi:signal transduction histidine kinase/DNA-binding response OmpR family regulator